MRHVIKQPDAEESKPLTEPVLLILMSLADMPRHGYALMKDIETLSDGRVRLSTGTLYGALRRLLQDKWIERFEQADKSREKQAYKLTRNGRRQLELELNRMKQLTRVGTARLRTERRMLYLSRAYGIFLRLYPADHRLLFGREMLTILEEAAGEHCSDGMSAFTRFALMELTGLMMGAGAEWLAKLVHATCHVNRSVACRCLPDWRQMRPVNISRKAWFALLSVSAEESDFIDQSSDSSF